MVEQAGRPSKSRWSRLWIFWQHTPMSVPAKVTLGVGYALAGPALVALLPALRNPAGRIDSLRIPHRAVIAAELLGGGCITSGWLAGGRRDHALFNACWVIVCTTSWIHAEKNLHLKGQRP